MSPPPAGASTLGTAFDVRRRGDTMRDAAGAEMPSALPENVVVDDPVAMRAAALLGLGVALLAVPDVLPYLERGDLVRLVPRWYSDAGAISLYYASRLHQPTTTGVFIETVIDAFRRDRLAEQLAGSLG